MERDLAAAELVNEVAPFEGDSAFLWALEISGEEKRNQALSTAVTEWAKQDADEARLVVESSELSATMKNSLLRTIADSLLGNPSPKSKKR